jgi:hypothetical protein
MENNEFKVERIMGAISLLESKGDFKGMAVVKLFNKIKISFKIIEIEDGLTIFCENTFFDDNDLFEKVKQAVLKEYDYHINAVK